MKGVTARLKAELQTPGHCIACDCALPKTDRKNNAKPRTLLCGAPACYRAYHAMWKSKARELTFQTANAAV